MTEHDKTTSIILKSETEEMESKDKDKDKLKDNDLKSIFNVVVNNYSDISNPDSSKKKMNKEHSFRKISFQNYFSKVKKKYIVNNNSQDKGIKLNKDSSKELLTIINSSKIQNSLPHFLFSRDKDKFKYHKKKKGIKVDMYNSKKYRSIKPQRDFFFKNKSSIFSSDDNDKLKTKLVKKKNYR
jgi:hypothetical protein